MTTGSQRWVTPGSSSLTCSAAGAGGAVSLVVAVGVAVGVGAQEEPQACYIVMWQHECVIHVDDSMCHV